MGKATETTESVYRFLVEDWLKIILDKLIKVEGKDVNKDVPDKKEEKHGKEKGN